MLLGYYIGQMPYKRTVDPLRFQDKQHALDLLRS